jgi:hypothetical protein
MPSAQSRFRQIGFKFVVLEEPTAWWNVIHNNGFSRQGVRASREEEGRKEGGF